MTPEELFPAPPAENHWTGDPYWNLQLGAYAFAIQLCRTLSPGLRRNRVLRLLRDCVTEAQADLHEPTSIARTTRLRQTVAPYLATPQPTIDAMLKLANPTSDDVLYDLGCGDGRIAFTAVREYGCRAVGIEINDSLYLNAIEEWAKHPYSFRERVMFVKGDVSSLYPLGTIWQWGESKVATIITVFWLSATMRTHMARFKALRPGTRIISNTFDFGPDWPAESIIMGPPSEPYRILKWTV